MGAGVGYKGTGRGQGNRKDAGKWRGYKMVQRGEKGGMN